MGSQDFCYKRPTDTGEEIRTPLGDYIPESYFQESHEDAEFGWRREWTTNLNGETEGICCLYLFDKSWGLKMDVYKTGFFLVTNHDDDVYLVLEKVLRNER